MRTRGAFDSGGSSAGPTILGYPRRRVLLGIDAVLVAAILWFLLTPAAGKPAVGAHRLRRSHARKEAEDAPNAAAGAPRDAEAGPSLKRVLGEGGSAAAEKKQKKMAKKAKKTKKKWQSKRHSGGRGIGDDGGGRFSKGAADVGLRGTARAPKAACGAALRDHKCEPGRKVLVTLSIGKRSHFAVTRVPMEAYARRVGAEFVVVDSAAHASLASWNVTLRAGSNSHFLKLPMLQWFLQRYAQVFFLDDDVLVSPFAPDLFSTVPCTAVGAVVEAVHAQGWHTMHGRAFCSIYELKGTHPAVCSKAAVKDVRIFNSGVMLLSAAHLPLFDGWERRKLECKILCDQLYMNAMLHTHDVCLHDLGTGFNLPGTTVRKLLVTTEEARAALADAPLDLRDSILSEACIIHLTVLPSKTYTSHYLLARSLRHSDVMRCASGDHTVDRAPLLAALPSLQYDITKIWCKGWKPGCAIIPPAGGGPPALGSADGEDEPSPPPPLASADAAPADAARCSAHAAAAAAAADPPLAKAVSNATEMPGSALRILHRAAAKSWDCNSVVLLFATGDFMDLAINWAQAAQAVGVTNFVTVAMDSKLGDVFARFDAPPGLLLPRVARGDVLISKLNVIGERQRFGLRTLEAGFNVLFADLDAILLRPPAPILADGDIIGERIWGRPMSVVRKWGAAICTGFYYIRSNPRTIKLFRATHFMIAEKRARQRKWQASDQWAINHAVDDAVVRWDTPTPMASIASYKSKFFDNSSAHGYTKAHRSKFVVLPHVHVARSCPILKYGTAPPPASDVRETRKHALWQHLLKQAYVLHCFPPDSMPCPGKQHGEGGCDKSVIMGSAVHIHGEVVFDQRQGLWFMKEGWEQAIVKPATKDFFAWLRSQHNGAKPGRPPPAAS